jgi:hypothetical protein
MILPEWRRGYWRPSFTCLEARRTRRCLDAIPPERMEIGFTWRCADAEYLQVDTTNPPGNEARAVGTS